MGCGKSKHDVASGNTVLQRKKSSVDSTAGQENGTETKGINNNNNNNNVVDNETSKVQQNSNDNVKEINGVGGKAPEITNVQEDKALEKSQEAADAAEKKAQEVIVAEGTPDKCEDGKDDSLDKNEQKVNDASAAAQDEKEGEETLVKEEETQDTNHQEENLAKEVETKEITQEEPLAKEEETKETAREEPLAKEEEVKETTREEPLVKEEGESKDLKAEQGQ